LRVAEEGTLAPALEDGHRAGTTPGGAAAGLLVQREVGAPRRRAAAAGLRGSHRRGTLAPSPYRHQES